MSLQLHTLKLVTIIAESVLKERITRDIMAKGAKGYSVSEVDGEGSRHLRAGEHPGQNVKFEIIVDEAVAVNLLETVSKHYFTNYAVIAYCQDVQVIRGDKYV